jgi:hypothetical protein
MRIASLALAAFMLFGSLTAAGEAQAWPYHHHHFWRHHYGWHPHYWRHHHHWR